MRHINRVRVCKYCGKEHKQVEMLRICKTSEMTGKLIDTNAWCCNECADKEGIPF